MQIYILVPNYSKKFFFKQNKFYSEFILKKHFEIKSNFQLHLNKTSYESSNHILIP